MSTASPMELRALLPELLAEIDGAGTIVVASHVNPDGDALGSALAFSMILDQMGKEHDVVFHHEAPANLEFLPGIDRVKKVSRWSEPDLGVILDLESLSRLGSLEELFGRCKRTVVIDHHVVVESPGDLRIVSTKSPATAAILADLFLSSDFEISADIATCLLAGIVTDTGSFRYPNTTSHSMHVAAELLERGADLRGIIQEVYMTRTLPSVRLHGHVLADMETACKGQLAWVSLPYSLFESAGATDEDTEGLVNEMLAVKGVKIAAILRESKPGKIRGSLRSRGEIDVAEAAREFGGGGHKNAAGVSFDGDLKVAEESLVEVLKKCLA